MQSILARPRVCPIDVVLISSTVRADDVRDGLPRTDTLPDDIQRRLNVYKAGGALLLIAVWGWFALVKSDQTPIFIYLNIAVHEPGHVLFRPFGELTILVMGSGFEVLFPLAVGAFFLLRRRDLILTAVAWGRAASALASAATYIGDADDGRLALLGAGPDTAGDWERILGEEFFDKVYLADRIAGIVRLRRPRPPGRPRSPECRWPPSTTKRCGADRPDGPVRELEYDAPARTRGSVGWLEAASSSNGSGRCRCSPRARAASCARSPAW